MAAAASDVNVNVAELTGHFDIDAYKPYNLVNVGRHVVISFEKTFNFCSELKLVNCDRTCSRCRQKLKLSIDRREDHSTPVVFRCTNSKRCKAKCYVSIRDGSFFEHAKLSLQQVLVIVNLFCSNICSYEQTQYQTRLTETDTTLSTETVADWLSYCREVCLEVILRETSTLIGGEGLTVEVDESKFRK